ncbi:MAG: ANTAR domain-containing protein [Thermodesulfobacteriota bacterium]
MRNLCIISDKREELIEVKGLLEGAGYNVVGEGTSGFDAIELCRRFSPDALLMDMLMPGMDGIEAARTISLLYPTTLILLIEKYDEGIIKDAAEAGTMACLVKPLEAKDLFPAIELAISRFRAFLMLKDENISLREELKSREVLEKAKRILMERMRLSEGEAFKRIRKMSMDARMTKRDIAETVILSWEGGMRVGSEEGSRTSTYRTRRSRYYRKGP